MIPLLRRLVGTRRDWRLDRLPRISLPRPGLHWLGPIGIVVSVLVGWPAFSGATGEDGNVAFGLFIGAASIVLMAWSFVLALRPRFLERFFGGLDSMYRSHRWAGALAVVAMFLHTRAEPEIEGGIRGASESLADQAEGLAGTGETMLYILVALSLIRWFPYRYWRWTHKLLGIPFAFACYHFFTAEKTYANGSAWGWYFGLIMAAGLGTYLWRVVVRDMLAQGKRYRITSAERDDTTTTIEMAPLGDALGHRAGQFAFVKLQSKGMREPHAFTVASSPESGVLRFHIRELGDWSAKLRRMDDLVGTDVIVEGPYGQFEPFGHAGGRTVWVAGGVGITPFLAALDSLQPAPESERPHLIYAVRTRENATAISVLEHAEAEGRITLTVHESATTGRLSSDRMASLFPDGLAGAHVAMCGPTGLIADLGAVARSLGADEVETEDFDIRQGVGPDLSADVEDAIGQLADRRARRELTSADT